MNALSSKLDKLASTVPSLPSIVQELKKAIDNPDSSVSSLEQIVNKDPAFAARILKVANSAYYGFSSKVGTISQALMMLGLSELRSLLVATSLAQVFKGITNEKINMESFWKHSVACAICSRNIAVKYREPNTEEFFLAGLIHDLGRLVMLCNLPEKTEEAQNMALEQRVPITKAEEKVLSFNHADLSSRILQEWKLPENLQEMVARHHNPLPSSAHFKSTLIVHVSDVIVETMEIGNSGEGVISASPEVNIELFQNNEAALPSVMDEVDSMTEDLARIFLSD